MNNPILQIKNVSMRFILSREKIDNFKDYLFKTLKKNIKYNDYYALKNVSFDVQKGDRVAILGLNGAGKSTLLKVIAGVYHPTEGTVVKKGKIIPLLELGAGFEKQYTGRENIFLYGAFLGYSKEFIESKIDEIIEFSELGKFIDMPIMNYSSGMRARLGFSIATIVQPEIIILDEVLSVGDARFKEKSEKKILSLMKDDVTVLFVSHNIRQVKNICNKAVIIDKGTLVAQGDVDEVCAVYQKMLNAGKQSTYDVVSNDLPAPQVSITLNEKGKPKLKWKPVDGAHRYQIFHSEDGKEFKHLVTTVYTVATVTKAMPDTEYFYKVRIVAADGTYSKFSNTVDITTTQGNDINSEIMATYNVVSNDLPAPVLTITLNEKGKPKLRWKAVDGAVRYQVFRSADGENYDVLTETSLLGTTNTKRLIAKKYYYKLRAVAADGTFSSFSNVESVELPAKV